MDIIVTKVGKQKAYYTEDRPFSVPELKILVDAVQAASFITEKKTEELVDKIANLGGTNRAETLKSNRVHFNTRKHTNENIYYNVDAIEDALGRRKKIIFRYFDLDLNGQKCYRRDGHHYVAEPVALVYNEDNYYAILYSERHDDTANYRVDRMDSVEVIDDDITEKALHLRDDVAGYTGQVIKMYGGEPKSVTLEFDNTLVGSVFDRFGEGVKMESLPMENSLREWAVAGSQGSALRQSLRPETSSGQKMKEIADGKVTATVEVQVSPTFWGWVFQFGEKMKVVSPPEVVEEYETRVNELRENINPSIGWGLL